MTLQPITGNARQSADPRHLQESDIGGGGERVDHRIQNDLFFAHLSLYRFALPWARGARTLDAGCGTGYGAAYLAENGARSVLGVDIDAGVIGFGQVHFLGPNLKFATMDIERLEGLEAGSFDLIFSSNTLEHLSDVNAFLRASHQLLAPGGVLLVAVPAVFNVVSRVQQLSNPYHLVIWSPEQWHYALGRYFLAVDGWRHLFARHDVVLDVHNEPTRCVITEEDFAFEPLPVDDLRRDTLTNIFVASKSRPHAEIPAAGELLDSIDDSFIRQRPRLTPLSLEEARVAPNPLRSLPLRALATLGRHGPKSLVAEARSYVIWRLRRRMALQLLGSRAGEYIETPLARGDES